MTWPPALVPALPRRGRHASLSAHIIIMRTVTPPGRVAGWRTPNFECDATVAKSAAPGAASSSIRPGWLLWYVNREPKLLALACDASVPDILEGS